MSAFTTPSDISGALGGSPILPTTELQRQALKDLDHEQRRKTAEERWEEVLEEDPHPEEPAESLIEYIKQAFEDAKCARQSAGMDDKIVTGRRMMKGKYTAQELAKMPEIDVWSNLVSTISNIALAFLRSALDGDKDNPLWELTHSPIPELPEFVVERAAEFAAIKVQMESQVPDPNTGVPVPLTEARAVEITEELRKEIFEAIDREADVHTRNLQKAIADAYQTADYYEVLDEFLQCLVVDPLACIKGPVVSSKLIPEWKNGRKVHVKRKYQHFETIDTANFYPSPDSLDAQTGSFVIEVDRMTRRQLIDAAKLKGFIAENIDIILCEYDDKSRDWLNPLRSEIDTEEGGRWREYEGVDVIKFHGQVPGVVLRQFGLKKLGRKDVDPKDTYEMEVWTTCDHIIRAVPACNEGRRPFHCASLYPCKGSIWGDSIPQRAADEQRAANAALRAAIRDMGFSSGPIMQTDVSMLDENQKVPQRFHAGMNIKTNSRKRGLQGSAVKIDQITSQAPLFLNLLDKFFLNAELNTGFNRQMMGQAQPGIGTLGEANLLQGNAATSLRSILKGIDKVIEGTTEMTACQIMESTDDPALKSDARVVAKGSSHLLDRELNKANLLQIMSTIFPMAQQMPGLFEPSAMACLVRELTKTFGMDPDKFVPDPALVERRNLELLMSMPGAGRPQGTPSAPPGLAGGPSQAPQVLPPSSGNPVPNQLA